MGCSFCAPRPLLCATHGPDSAGMLPYPITCLKGCGSLAAAGAAPRCLPSQQPCEACCPGNLAHFTALRAPDVPIDSLVSILMPLACSPAAMAASAGAAAGAVAGGDEFVETVAEELSREVFATYTCRSSAAGHGQPHPGDIAEPSSLAAIPLPPTDYPLWDSLGGAVAAQGKLSQLQLEGVMYACAKHLTWLPSGERCGFFIGGPCSPAFLAAAGGAYERWTPHSYPGGVSDHNPLRRGRQAGRPAHSLCVACIYCHPLPSSCSPALRAAVQATARAWARAARSAASCWTTTCGAGASRCGSPPRQTCTPTPCVTSVTWAATSRCAGPRTCQAAGGR